MKKEKEEKIACHICQKMIPKAAVCMPKGKNTSFIFAISNAWITGETKIKKN